MKQITIDNFLRMTPQVPQFSEKNTNYLISGADPLYYLNDSTQEEQIGPLTASLDWKSISVYNSTLIANYENTDSTRILHAGTYIKVGQSFLNTSASVLSKASFYIKKFGSPTGSITASIYAHSGTFGTSSIPTGSPLATSEAVSIASLTTSLVWTDFLFTTFIPLTTNTPYVIVINYSGGDVSNYLEVAIDATSLTADGNESSTVATTWFPDSTLDVDFRVYAQTLGVMDGNITHMVSSPGGTFTSYAITNTSKVYGITTLYAYDLGYSTGGAISNTKCYLGIGGNSLYATNGGSGSIYYMPLSSGAWSSTTGLTSATGTHFLEQFADHIAVADGTTTFSAGNQVKLIDPTSGTPTVLSTPILNVGLGFGVNCIRNYNDKYLAVAVCKETADALSGYPQNYIYLWDGAKNGFNYSVKVPGKFLDMKVVNSILYVAVQITSGKTCIYYLKGTQLVKLFTTQVSTISQNIYSDIACPLFDFRTYLGVRLSSTSELTYPLLINGNDEIGLIEFIHSSGKIFDQFVVDFNGVLIANVWGDAVGSTLYYLPTAGNYQTLLYKSQWIPVKNLQTIDIYYDNPPSSSTDTINVTLYGQGEDIITGSSTTPLESITPSTALNQKRTRLECKGFTGDQVMIKLTTTNSTWRPIIRRIVLITE